MPWAMESLSHEATSGDGRRKAYLAPIIGEAECKELRCILPIQSAHACCACASSVGLCRCCHLTVRAHARTHARAGRQTPTQSNIRAAPRRRQRQWGQTAAEPPSSQFRMHANGAHKRNPFSRTKRFVCPPSAARDTVFTTLSAPRIGHDAMRVPDEYRAACKIPAAARRACLGSVEWSRTEQGAAFAHTLHWAT